MADSRISIGQRGEAAARDFLERQGYTILDTNYRCPWGEVDIVASQGGELVFVEVRARQGGAMVAPEESLTPAKGRRLIMTAQHYLQSHPGPADWRIDLVVVRMDPLGRVQRVSLVQNAVTEDG